MSARDTSSVLKAACVLIETESQRGTGYLVAADQLLTCWHVVRDAPVDSIRLTMGSRSLRARTIQADLAHDCAVLFLDEPVLDVEPLPLADALPARNAVWESYGYPAAMLRSGILISGVVQDVHGQDLNERAAIVLTSSQATAGSELQGFSGSPVVSAGRVIGQLLQIVPDRSGGAQYGVLFACSAPTLRALLPGVPAPAGPASDAADRPQPPRASDEHLQRGRRGARRRWLWLLPLLAAGVAMAGAGLRDHLRSAAAVHEARQRLDALFVQAGDPTTPPACQTQDARVLAALLRAATLLSGSGIRTARPADRDALTQLKALSSDRAAASTAEWAVLLSRAHLAMHSDGTAARAAAEQAIARCPALAQAYKLLGNAEQLQNRPQAAAAAYRQALALAPGYLAPQFNLGLVALRLGDGQAASAAMDALLRLDPDYPDAQLVRGQALLRLGNPAGAEAALERAASATPERSEIWLLLGQARLSQGRNSEAQKAFCYARKLGSPEGAARCPVAP
jgi:tetratricopeptide (TPR) repeat protein